jgi:rhodanese-related sulfurtransferase
MKSHVFMFLLFLGVLPSAAIGDGDVAPEMPRMNAYKALELYNRGGAIIIDTMDAKTYNKYHILGAINLPGDNLKGYQSMRLGLPQSVHFLLYCD